MKPDYLIEEELIQAQKEKGNICISIIVPTHRLSPERRVDPLQVKKAVKKAKDYLQYKYTNEEIVPLMQSLDEIYGQIDFNRNADGVGLFVSRNIRQLVPFYFPVKEKVIISNAFEIRDWLYQTYYSKPYFVLLLAEKGARLYKGTFNALEEVKDKNFPVTLEEDYEYSRPSRGSSYVGHAFVKEFERDKSQMEEIRYENFLKRVDDILNSYLVDEIPLLITGAKKDLAYFTRITRHPVTSREIEGNYFHIPLNELGELSWELMRGFLDQSKQKLLAEWKEKIGEGKGINGIIEVWKAAKEGRAYKLLVEKDISCPGFLLKEDEYHLHLMPPKEAHYILPDAVNTLMETVLEKNGQVVMLENGALAVYGRIALISRY